MPAKMKRKNPFLDHFRELEDGVKPQHIEFALDVLSVLNEENEDRIARGKKPLPRTMIALNDIENALSEFRVWCQFKKP